MPLPYAPARDREHTRTLFITSVCTRAYRLCGSRWKVITRYSPTFRYFTMFLLTFGRYNSRSPLASPAFPASTPRNLRTRELFSPLVLGVAPRVLPVPVLILMAVCFFRLGFRLGVAFGDLVLTTTFGDDDHGGAVVAGLPTGNV